MSRLYITTASWEQRFVEGAHRILPKSKCDRVLCFWSEDYGSRTEIPRKELQKACGAIHCVFTPFRLAPVHYEWPTGSQVQLWKTVFDAFSREIIGVDEFIFDVSTTPRELLWIILDLLTEASIPGQIIYHRASKHGDWCAAEPELPHIVPKLGGISRLDWPTKLVILTGYDLDRSEHFIESFEPSETMLLLQSGDTAEDPLRNSNPHLKKFSGRSGLRIDYMNSYEPDWGYSFLRRELGSFGQDANLILASLGPKTSAVALYRLHREMPNSALAYSPCRDYNIDYSNGLVSTLTLRWDLQSGIAET